MREKTNDLIAAIAKLDYAVDKAEAERDALLRSLQRIRDDAQAVNGDSHLAMLFIRALAGRPKPGDADEFCAIVTLFELLERAKAHGFESRQTTNAKPFTSDAAGFMGDSGLASGQRWHAGAGTTDTPQRRKGDAVYRPFDAVYSPLRIPTEQATEPKRKPCEGGHRFALWSPASDWFGNSSRRCECGAKTMAEVLAGQKPQR